MVFLKRREDAESSIIIAPLQPPTKFRSEDAYGDDNNNNIRNNNNNNNNNSGRYDFNVKTKTKKHISSPTVAGAVSAAGKGGGPSDHTAAADGCGRSLSFVEHLKCMSRGGMLKRHKDS